MEVERDIVEIARLAAKETGRRLNPTTLACLKRPDFETGVADAKLIYSIKSEYGRDDCVIIFSNPAFPDAVSEAVEKTARVIERLPAEASRYVLLPIFDGRYGAQSFAVYPKLFAFSENRLICKLQKKVVEDEVYRWLSHVAKSTQLRIEEKSEFANRFVRPLEYITNERRFSEEIRKSAAEALVTAERPGFSPVCIVEHGDFWLGNVLLTDKWLLRKRPYGFAVIDWGSSNVFGYPFIDLLRFFDSASGRFGKVSPRVRQYCESADIPAADLPLYVLAALGYLGLHRNQFPMERYIMLAERCAALAGGVHADILRN